MSEQISNAQVQTPETPAATGPNVAELQARLAELERSAEGRLRDLQAERQKRQELEQRLSTPVSPAVNTGVEDDQVFNVVAPAIEKHPKFRNMEAQLNRMVQDKARQYLESKTGKSWSDLEKDMSFQDKLNAATMKYGQGQDLYETAVRAYENMKRDEELETYRAKEVERQRAISAANSGSLPVGAPPASVQGAREWTVADWNTQVSKYEYGELASKGDITVKDGKVIFTPKA